MTVTSGCLATEIACDGHLGRMRRKLRHVVALTHEFRRRELAAVHLRCMGSGHRAVPDGFQIGTAAMHLDQCGDLLCWNLTISIMGKMCVAMDQQSQT